MFVLQLFEDAPRSVVVTYPGRFQPFHKGHRDVFASLQSKFGTSNVYIVTGNKTDAIKSPFNFSDKVQFMHAMGIPSSQIIETDKVYDLPAQFQSVKDKVVFITVVGAPDAKRLNPGATKKDGSPAYFQNLPKDLSSAVTADQHGYVIVEPEHPETIVIGGQKYDVSHGTPTRALWNKVRNNPQQREEFIQQLYGRNDSDLGHVLDKIPATTESVIEDAAGVGVVKNSKDPRYVMAITGNQNDVDGKTLGKMMKAYHLIGKNPANTKQTPVTEAKSLHKRVKIVRGPDAGKYGWIREIKHGAFKGAEKRYYVDIEGGGQANNLSGPDLRIANDQQGAVSENQNPYGYKVGQTVKLHTGGQGRVIDIFDDSIEVLLPGGRTVTVAFQDANVLDEQGMAEGAEQMTPNWAKYVLDQIYNSDGAVTLTDLFDEGIPGLYDMFMDTAKKHGFDPEEDFEDVQHELTLELEDFIKGGHDLDEAQTDYQKRRQRERDVDAGKPVSRQPKNPQNDYFARRKKEKEQGVAEGSFRDDEFRNRERNAGLENETNNIAIAINGKTWKVIPGKGYADSPEERSYLNNMKNWAEKKSAASGKKWTVHLTGASITESSLSGQDTVSMDIPFLIRALEYAKEDAKTDLDLHSAVERMLDAAKAGNPLRMADYDAVFGKAGMIETIARMGKKTPAQYIKPMGENAEQLNVGDQVIVSGNVQYRGTTGIVVDFGQLKRFVVVDLYNHGKHSFHSSDVSLNDYAGSEEEESDHYQRDPDARKWAHNRDMEESMYQYNAQDPYNSEFAPDVGMGRMTLRGWKQSLARRVAELAKQLSQASDTPNVDNAALWDNVYKKLQAQNLDPIAQEIEQAHQELEKIRQRGGIRSRAFKR